MSSFFIDKWYLDCITEAGAVAIGYSARVRWGPIAIRYSGLWESAGKEKPARFRDTFVQAKAPVLTDARNCVWEEPRLDISGRWEATVPGMREVELWKGTEGSVLWQCHLPMATTSLGPLTGCGYVERLIMTVPPGKLPIKRLHWGRFHGSRHYLIWIRWEGEAPLSRVWLDGKLIAADVNDNAIGEVGAEVFLPLPRDRALRQGTPLQGILQRARIPFQRLPRAFAQLRECKWVCRTTLSGKAIGERDEGNALFETVDFGV